MGILKQNGTDGKILRNSEGKVLKQNYNFGNCLINRATTGSYYLNFPNHDIESTHAMLIWLKVDNASSSSNWISSAPTLGSNSYGNLWAGGGVWCYQDDVAGTYYTDKGLYYIDPVTHKVDAYRSAYKTVTRSSSLTLRVNPYAKIGRIVFFDREISEDEMVYYYNNNLGNDLLNKSGVISDFKWDTAAESVTIDEVEYAGFVDSISGFNCYFSNLPSGTVEEQIAYVNSNMVEIW